MMQIVDKDKLCEVLLISESTLKKTWTEYPHFYIGTGRDLRGARFIVEDVINYLRSRDYAESGQNQKNVDRQSSHKRLSDQNKKRIPNKNGGKRMGTVDKGSPKTSNQSGLIVLPGR